VRHEEAGAFAAGAEAHLTGTLAVCAGSCGPGNMHLINGRPQWHRPALSYPSHAPRAVSQSGCVAYRLDYGKEWRCHPYSIRRMVILSTVR
jgi:hypothetical protein